MIDGVLGKHANKIAEGGGGININRGRGNTTKRYNHVKLKIDNKTK